LDDINCSAEWKIFRTEHAVSLMSEFLTIWFKIEILCQTEDFQNSMMLQCREIFAFIDVDFGLWCIITNQRFVRLYFSIRSFIIMVELDYFFVLIVIKKNESPD